MRACIVFEFFLALHLSFAIAHTLYRVGMDKERVSTVLHRIEKGMNGFLGIPTSDYYHGYFMMWVPSICAVPILWMTLRTLYRIPAVQPLWLRLTGFVVVLIPSVVHVFVGPDLISYRPWATEIVILCSTLGCFLVVLFSRLNAPLKVSVPSFALLFGLWWLISGYYYWPTYDGPTGPFLGFCSAVAWVVYVNHRAPAMPISDSSRI